MTRILTHILTPLSTGEIIFRKNACLNLDNNGQIRYIDDHIPSDAIDMRHTVCIPGLVDCHVHYPQIRIRGKHCPGLLEWLETFVFPEERRFDNSAYASEVADEFFPALLSNGTTTAMVYSTLHPEACRIAFGKAAETGIRAIIGKVMMDNGDLAGMSETTADSIAQSIALYNEPRGPRLDYVFIPRFAPATTMELMSAVGAFTAANQARVTTHLSENLYELRRVRDLFPGIPNYTEVYDKAGLLHDRTVLAHCIHLTDAEIARIKLRNAAIAYCPDSNFFLQSGEFPWERIRNAGIRVGLGSDVGAGTTLNMFEIMRMAVYRVTKTSLSPAEAFTLATIGGARALGLQDTIGSIEPGHDADLVFLRHPDARQLTKEEILSELVYLGREMQVVQVMVAGNVVLQQN